MATTKKNSSVNPGTSKAPTDLPHWVGWQKTMQDAKPVKGRAEDH